MGALLSEPVTAMVVERSSTECWSAASATMQGWRQSHEDAHIFVCEGGGEEPSAVFAVLDGHGGQAAALAASELLEQRLRQMARGGTMGAARAKDQLEDIFVATDARLREQLPSGDRSGTTAVAAVVTRPRPGEYCIQIAHAGDSRAVVCLGHELTCTKDHKPEHEAEKKRILAAGGSVERGASGNAGPWRVDGSLATSRALGDFVFKPHDMDPKLCKVTALPEVSTVSHCAAGDWLLLACDGIFDVMSNAEVGDFVSERLRGAGQNSPDGGKICMELLRHCLDKGTKDNCSVCLVQMHEGGISRAHSRELLQGPWQKAKEAVQLKYSDFFVMHGFHEEAMAITGSFRRCQHPKCQYFAHTSLQNNPTHCCLRCHDTPLHEEPSHGPKCQHRKVPETLPRQQAQLEEHGGQGRIWEVIGGSATGGILVREERGLDSGKLGRLSFGATVREVCVQGGRLHYAKVQGEGPQTGWVSLMLQGRELLRLAA